MLLKTITTFVILFCCILIAEGQTRKDYDLIKVLKENKLDKTTINQYIKVLDSTQNHAISLKGFVWLKDVDFKEGTIDIDLRGKDVFLQSFLGIVFNAKDTLNYDLVFFRPFRFQSTDTPTRKWAVQYVSMPDHDYQILRKEHPGIYEHPAKPAPQATEWFHATIVIKGDWVEVYINHNAEASLKIKNLSSLKGGKIGLWDDAPGVSGDFANLSITN